MRVPANEKHIGTSGPETNQLYQDTRGLVDTGSKYNIVSNSRLKHFAYRRIRTHNTPVFRLANGGTTKPLMKVALRIDLLDASSAYITFYDEFWVLPDSCVDIILGMAFL
jgi:hypothetical protein